MDVYYDPEKYDLTIVGDLSEDLSYEFNELVVWQHKDGQVFWAQDGGCSCPSPFEDYTTLESLGDPLTRENWGPFQMAVDDFPANAVDKVAFLAKVAALTKEK